jgi:signal transduction histidine kinase
VAASKRRSDFNMADERLTQALSLAAHELRTPVTVIAGYLQMVLKGQGGPLSDTQRRMLTEAERSCGRISALVAELSELARLETATLAIERQPLDLSVLTRDVAASITEGLDRDVRLSLHGVDQPVLTTGDRERLTTVIRTLMHAVLRARGEPGEVTVLLRTNPDASPPCVILAVGDAAGIADLIAQEDATPALDEWRGGLGLALPVGRRVIEALGGALWSGPDGVPHQGFALRLPLRA